MQLSEATVNWAVIQKCLWDPGKKRTWPASPFNNYWPLFHQLHSSSFCECLGCVSFAKSWDWKCITIWDWPIDFTDFACTTDWLDTNMYSGRLLVWHNGKEITYRSKRWNYVHLCCLDTVYTSKYLVVMCCSLYTGHSCASPDGKSAYQRLCTWINSRKSNSLVTERLYSWRIIRNGNTLQFYKDMWPKDIFCDRINCHSCNWHVFYKLGCRNKAKSN